MERGEIKNCNALGRYENTDWMAIQYRAGKFYDPSGLKILIPVQWKHATPDEIATEYEKQGVVPLSFSRLSP